MFSKPVSGFSAARFRALADPRSPATSAGGENSAPWWPRYNHPAPGTPARVQVGTFRISFVLLHPRCPDPDTRPETRREQPLPLSYKTLSQHAFHTNRHHCSMESRFWEAAVSTRFHRKIRHKRLFDSARRGILIVRNNGRRRTRCRRDSEHSFQTLRYKNLPFTADINMVKFIMPNADKKEN